MKHHICWYLPYLIYYYNYCTPHPPTNDVWYFSLILSSLSIETPGQLLKVSLSWETSRPTEKNMGKICKDWQSSKGFVSWFFKSCNSCDLILLKSMPVRCLPSAWPMKFLPRHQKDWFRTEDSTTIGAVKPESEKADLSGWNEFCTETSLPELYMLQHIIKRFAFTMQAYSQLTCQKRFVSFCKFSDFNLDHRTAGYFRVSSHVCQFIPSHFGNAGSVDRKGTSHEQLCKRSKTTWHISNVCWNMI